VHVMSTARRGGGGGGGGGGGAGGGGGGGAAPNGATRGLRPRTPRRLLLGAPGGRKNPSGHHPSQTDLSGLPHTVQESPQPDRTPRYL
jgi:hypothetical protein